MNDLHTYFKNNDKRLIDKWIHYFKAYENHFSRFRNKEVVILEIGVYHGGSLQLWKNYFGPKAKIYGIDINPDCKALEEENIKIFIGSQSDRNFLRQVKKEIPAVDILIDDGGHTMIQQIVSFEELFDLVKEDGVYLCEDIHTSYWSQYGGGHKRRGSFIEYAKNWIDDLNAYHSEQKSLQVSPFTKVVESIHFYDSMVFIEKTRKTAPYREVTGTPSFPNADFYENKSENIFQKFQNSFLKRINKMLQWLRLKSI